MNTTSVIPVIFEGTDSLNTTLLNTSTYSNPALLPGWPTCQGVQIPLPPGSFSKATKWIATIVPPVIVIFGMFGNILTMIVLSRTTKFSSTSMYLIALAVSDTIFLINGPLRQWIRHVWKFEVRGVHDVLCKLMVWLTYGSLQFSNMILVALTLERLFSILWPHKTKASCTTLTSKVILAGLFIFVAGLNSHFYYGVGSSKLPYYTDKTCMPMYEGYRFFFHHIWHWINFAVSFAIPFLVLAVGNGIIIIKLKKFLIRRKQMSVMRTKRDSESAKEQRTLTFTLILLSVVFFLSQTPMNIYYIYAPYGIARANELACENYAEYTQQAEIIWLCYTVVNILGYLNAMLNFVLYVISGTRFRKEVMKLMLCQGSREADVFVSTASSSDIGRNRISRNDGICTITTSKYFSKI